MKTHLLKTLTMAFLVLPISQSQSQQQQQPTPAASVVQALEALRAGNEEMLARQKATLVVLEELQKDAQQLKTFGKRT